jgi:hypothetical protein
MLILVLKCVSLGISGRILQLGIWTGHFCLKFSVITKMAQHRGNFFLLYGGKTFLFCFDQGNLKAFGFLNALGALNHISSSPFISLLLVL